MHPDPRRKLTRADCAVLENAGLLEPERHELIDGYLVPKSPKSRPQALVGLRLSAWLQDVFGRWRVERETPIDLTPALNETNEPEPDVTVLTRPSDEFPKTAPRPADLLLVAEVSATTQDYDLGAKAALYATAGIAEYWVLDLRDFRLIVHRNPTAGRYASIVAYTADEPVSPLAAPSEQVRLRDLLV
jgi:Uma2 family endonuclease